MNQMIMILGVTASGKSTLAFDLAKSISAEIISIDSMKVYLRMDIGTAKPSLERRKAVKHHLIDIFQPSESCTAGKFLDLTHQAMDHVKAAKKPMIAAGGTALYTKTLLYGMFDGPPANQEIRNSLKNRINVEGTAGLHRELTEVDPQAAQRIHPNDARRIIRAMEVYKLTGKPISSFQSQFSAEKPLDDWKIIGLRRPKDQASRRINMRVKKMAETGLLEEVKNLLAEDAPLSKQAAAAIGYAEIIDHFKGETTLDEAIERIKVNTRKFAKSQRTWFKTFKNVTWLEIEEDETPQDILKRTLNLL
ncbi:MAG: tRNA (adenosine(37)-N6)-dimethylallyltransferase MiaA [Planctomycetes bacterium]|nr:tRNA (adenosine(37)-N6)-dimethylallyltransferase MiaA [Planctomycetota bacterium]